MKFKGSNFSTTVYFFSILILLIGQTANAATFVVDNNLDVDNALPYTLSDGTNSLRKCIRLSNAAGGADIINFNIPAAPYMINLVGADLPTITTQITIDGLTQPGAAAGSLLIEINAAGRFNGLLYQVGSANSILQGIAINGSNRGIYLDATSAVTIVACNVGTNAAGTIALPCFWNGIQIDNSPDVVIGGNAGVTTRNIISGNNEVGIRVDNSLRTLINGNYIGVNITGNTVLANLRNGIQFANACHNGVIGNGLAGGGNVVSGNNQEGIFINNSTGITMKGNTIGLGANGTTVIPNLFTGVFFNGGSNNAQIGGSSVLERNICSANLQSGFRIIACSGVIISGNYIGTDITGLVDRGNTETGIYIEASNTITVGGFLAGQGNVISGNNQNGVFVINSLSPSFYGNIIGLNATGTALISNNENGISINFNSNGATIGGATALHRNVISGNLQNGIYITQSTSPVLYGNFIGTDITGSVDLGNSQNGASINNTSNNPIIGGALAGQGNLISGNNENGLRIENCTSPIVKGNIMGLNSTATAALPNGYSGLYIINSASPTVGGTTAFERNYISGNTESGLFIQSSASPTVLGNFVGVNVTGTLNLGNGQQGMSFLALNGAIIGNGTLAGMNIVSGNGFNGIILNATTNAVVRGNIVGSDITGLVDLGNGQSGILITNVSSDPLIGGAVAGQGNLISGNAQTGLNIDNSLRPIIKGNTIGMASDGTTILTNGGAGIALFTACNNAVIGGATLAEKNLVSGNTQIGINVDGSLSPTIYGNYIGTDITGLLDRGNLENGININNGSTNAIIGSATAGTGNLISGNNQKGIGILNSNFASVKGNIIGLGIDGTTALGNIDGGITNENSSTPIIGGTTLAERNLISSNGGCGILINNSINALIKANYIGVDVTGLLARGNGQAGAWLFANSNGAVIGGPSLIEGNIMSNNAWAGILINTCNDVVIKSCIIGLGSDRSTPFPNLQNGITFTVNSLRLIIGGVLVTERNYVSSNNGNGISLADGCNDATIVNNYVGVDGTGLLARPNIGNGISIDLSNRATVGGVTVTSRNIFSSNRGNGILLNNRSNDAVVKANYVGVGANGSTVLGNWDNGLNLADSSNQATVGGSTAAESNVFSGNGVSGVGDGIRSLTTSRHVILGNYCGVDATSTIAVPNAWAGISLNESNNCIVGGPGALEGNICSGNLNEGVYFRNAFYTTFIGNFVGTDRTGLLQLGNDDWGINIRAVSLRNKIGGSSANANTIAFNKNIGGLGPGVYVEGGSQRNEITYNKIYCNAGLGIDLDGVANENIAAPTIVTSTTNQITGNGSINGDVIHVYKNFTTGTGCDCEGEQFIGTAIIAGGAWTLTHNLGLTTTEANSLTATETTALLSTSEFASCIVSLPVSLIYFEAKKLNSTAAIIEWKTVTEINNNYFLVLRSTDGIHFEPIGTVDGAGNSSSLLSYSFVDENPTTGINYYQLKQVDFNGTSSYSTIKAVDFAEVSLGFISEGLDYFITLNKTVASQINYTIISADGKVVRSVSVNAGINTHRIAVDVSDLAMAIYYIRIDDGVSYIADKMLVQ